MVLSKLVLLMYKYNVIIVDVRIKKKKESNNSKVFSLVDNSEVIVSSHRLKNAFSERDTYLERSGDSA